MPQPDFDVVILTDSRYVNPSAPGGYVQNILTEDRIVKEALQNIGLKVDRKDWADPDFDWSSTKAVLFRTTWDYFNRFDEFKGWMENTSSRTHFINTEQLIRWNMDKHYLDDLSGSGVNVVPTRYLDSGNGLSIHQIHTITGWQDTVIKPTVGGAGRHTYRIHPKNMDTVAQKLEEVMLEEDFMLQPFQESVITSGEWSFVFFGETFSHAVLKKAKPGDFRVQDDFGGTVHAYSPKENEIEFARRALLACPELPAYARVDMVLNNSGELAVSELELIEPELWFRMKPEAANLLAEEVAKRIP
ncbi:RimK family alpha-L-glutamate ligase [Gracilimonas sediminicola]|uniref:ATP-grasp domain-containing protein n=1 Tax=Gracilimonas sediminicola TaxID=2952158 RepID=UPI0038D3AB98